MPKGSNNHTSDAGQAAGARSGVGGPGRSSSRKANRWGRVALFGGIAVVWLVLDMLSKYVAEGYSIGTVFAGPFSGVLQFKLVHNTGAAWSMLSGSTFALGVFAVVVLAALIGCVVAFAPRLAWLECAALGLVLAGGVGNALDRFFRGYVVDFIQTLFISFPTFNVADIGVTCGIILFALSFTLRSFKEGN